MLTTSAPRKPFPAGLAIRPLTEQDAAVISAAFALQGWEKPVQQYQGYFREMLAGARAVLVAEVSGEFAGYLTVLWEADYPPFREASIPMIVDFNVLKRFQRRGIGTALMDEAESQVANRSPLAGLCVGLTPDYGPAQVLYARRGYVPDGRGALWQGEPVGYGDAIRVDDNLELALIKQLEPLALNVNASTESLDR